MIPADSGQCGDLLKRHTPHPADQAYAMDQGYASGTQEAQHFIQIGFARRIH
jgi:hypothetical protein